MTLLTCDHIAGEVPPGHQEYHVRHWAGMGSLTKHFTDFITDPHGGETPAIQDLQSNHF